MIITLKLPTDALSTNLCSASAEHTGVKYSARCKFVAASRLRAEVMKSADVALLSEPRYPEPDVQIMCPPMRAVFERMRNLSDVITMRVNSSGCLRLSASTGVVKADTTRNDCSHPPMTRDDASWANVGSEGESV
ncbi:hypothetical protein EI94DRAFT_1742631 [Lactarius quietus]|nr:hypothetical protein EI94DRAFT_1742631 [Lactarius quietus]